MAFISFLSVMEITKITQAFVHPGSSDKLLQIKLSNTAVLMIWLYYLIFNLWKIIYSKVIVSTKAV